MTGILPARAHWVAPHHPSAQSTPGAPGWRVVRGHPVEPDRGPVNDELRRPGPSSLEVTVCGTLAASVLRALEDRYDGVAVSRSPEVDTVETVAAIDQAGERAVLTLLRDTGRQVGPVWRPAR